MCQEVSLKGGRSTDGIVRLDNTVRRPLKENADYIHALLKLLEKEKFTYAPKFLGIDNKNREILEFIEGDVPFGKNDWTEGQLIKGVQILREYHDITSGTTLAREREVVSHNDFAPWNMIMQKNTFVGVIDFDGAAPGDRAEDLSYFLWTFLSLGSNISVHKQAEKMTLLCKAYGFSGGIKLIKTLLVQQEKILQIRKNLAVTADTEEERQFSKERIEKIQSEINWVKNHRDILEKVC